MKIVNKDILTVTDGIICHQVNCKGVMGAGLALALRKKYPFMYERYKVAYFSNRLILGTCDLISVAPSLFIANLCSQENYGHNGIYTDYDAFESCLNYVSKVNEGVGKQIYLPYYIGCGLAGGDWTIVSSIIDKVIPDALICKK